MSNFVVSARKYRPVRFDEVVGQQHVSKTLKNAMQNDQLAHAFLFCGPRGVGKTTCARILAKVLNCENLSKDKEACNECSSCTAFNENASFNISELDAASNNSVEHIRALIEKVRFQPQKGQYKVFIIDEVHMLSQAAFNAFLKTLEEPPSYAIFILATTEKHKIIPTILSRCQIFDFRRIQTKDMINHMLEISKKEKIAVDENALYVIAQKADGALRDALSIYDKVVSALPAKGEERKLSYELVIENLNVLDYDYFFKIVDALLIEDQSSVLMIMNEIFRAGFESDVFVGGLAEHLRNILVCKDEQTLELLEVNDKLKERYKTQAKNTATSWVLTAMNICNDCDVNYKMARNKRLHVEIALIKIAFINSAIKLADQQRSQQVAPVGEKKLVAVAPMPKVVKEITPPVAPKGPAPNNLKTTELKTEEQKATSQTDDPKPEIRASIPVDFKRKSKYAMPKLDSLADLKNKVVEEDATQSKLSSRLNLENLEAAWKDYASKVNSPSVRITLSKTELKLDGKKIIAIVPSEMARGMIQQENDLMDSLRATLNDKALIFDIQIDTSKATQVVAPVSKKVLSTKEKYEKMLETNPLLDVLRKRFDLKVDPKG